MGNLSSHNIYPMFNASKETPRQSNDNLEYFNGVSTKSSLQSTLDKVANTSGCNENKITNEPNRQKPDTYVQYCKTCLTQLSKTGNEKDKLHDIVIPGEAADKARKLLKRMNQNVRLKNVQLLQSCSDNIKQRKDKRQTPEELHRAVDSEYHRIGEALKVKRKRDKQYEEHLQDLQKERLTLEENIKSLDKILEEIESCSDIDLLCKKDTFTEKIQTFQTDLHMPSFDVEGESVEDPLMQTVYSQKEKEQLKQKEKEHEQLQMEREYFKDAFETVMMLLKSLVNYRGNKGDMNGIIKFSQLPKIPEKLEKSLTKVKKRRTTANEDLRRFKNIAIELIDFERKNEPNAVESSKERSDEETTLIDFERKNEPNEVESSKERSDEESTYETDEFMLELERVKAQKELLRNTVKTLGKWINICHESGKQSEIDQDEELTLPSEPVLRESGKHVLGYSRKQLKDIRQQIKELENKVSSTSKQLEVKENEAKTATSEREKALESIKQLKKEISSTSKQLEETEKETKAVTLEREKTQESMEQLEREMSSISTQLEEKRKEAEVANLERDRALTRLSEVAGSRLRENNPMIADLSDDYRPTKLGEKFGEVYDNEWTDAYQSISKKLNLTEKEAIRLLLEFVKVIYETCTEIAQTQLNDMFSSIKVKQSAKETKVPGFLKKIKDFQKQITPEMMAVVAKAIKKKKFKNVKLEEGFKPCGNYIHSCIQLCWMMNVQDPPVVLVFDEEIGADINTGLFRYYTKSGRSMDYMVWPAMLLHKDGALLQKGVVQPQ